MLKQTVTYRDFDDVEHTETLYFNITKSELLDNTSLRERLEKSAKMLQGVERELTPEEVTEVVQLVKLFMKLAYGVRSEDGRRFKKNDDIWAAFTETAVYDEFFMSLFTDPDKAMNFLTGVVPKDLLEQAKAEQQPTPAPPVPTEPARSPFARPTEPYPLG